MIESLSEELSVERVMGALRNCYDPEIPVNIVDLGQPGNSVGSATFGVIRTAGSMRKVQLGARFTF